MTAISELTEEKLEEIRQRYRQAETPKCHICGMQMTIQRMSAGRVTYGCTGVTYDATGGHYADGRSIADDHYAASRTDFIDVSDPDVITLADAFETACRETEELSEFKSLMASGTKALKSGEPIDLESLFRGKTASSMFAMMFAGEFVRSGAKNYLELLYEVPEFGGLTVTLQKVQGKTPAQRIEELEQRIAELEARSHIA